MEKLLAFFKMLLRPLVGEISWRPPGWCRWLASHRVLMLLVLVLIGAGWKANDWWQHRPRPKQIEVTVQPIELTPLREKLSPKLLQIDFSDSAAPLDAVGKPLKSGIVMEPAADGEWQWNGDSRLVFCPKNDWPAGQTYRIRFEPGLTRADIPLDKTKLTVTTPKFTGTIREFAFYQDPTDPAVRQLVATLEFTHPVRHGDLESRAAIDVLGGSDIFSGEKPRFTVEYGLHDRTVYLRSSPLRLPPKEDFARLTLPRGLHAATGGDEMKDAAVAKVKVPDLHNFFRIESVSGEIARKDNGEPEQVLLVQSTAEVKPETVASALELRLLPPRKPHEEAWSSPREITPEIIAKSTKVPVTLIPAGRPTATQISFKFKLEQSGRLYVVVKKGIEALGGYPLEKDYDNVLPVPEPPKELDFQGEGGLLALGGERKLSVKSRGIPGIHYEIARVRADQINHLVSQTEGGFQHPEFLNGSFDAENISVFAEEKQPIAMSSRFPANYSTFDFASHLAVPADGNSERGLFFLRAKSWDPKTNRLDGPETSARFILVTDLGLLAKFDSTGGVDIFVVSVKSGIPAAGVRVDLLGKNGIALAGGVTGKDGHVALPKLTDDRREKQPVAFVARLGDDVSFLPYDRGDRELDFSRFDTGGVSNINPEALDAFAFSERGIYRPGDTVHLAFAVKQRNWQGNLDGLPIEVEVTDARGKTALKKRLNLTRDAFSAIDFDTQYESPSGRYNFDVYLVKNGYRDIRLGGTSFTVKEFQPDRMKLETKLNKDFEKGWISPDDLGAILSLQNLYGTPASGRRITSTLTLSPTGFSFDAFPGYQFYDRLLDQEKHPREQNVELAEQTTGEDGKAEVPFGLDKFAKSTWLLHYYAEAFEGNSGRCVTGQASALVSAQPWLIGHKGDGDLDFIQTGSTRTVSFVAVDPALKQIALENLEGRLIERRHLSMLVKKPNGNYGYESVEELQEMDRSPVAIPADGLVWTVPTKSPGDFVYEIWNSDGLRVASVGFRVVGVGEVTRSLDRNSELQIQLDKLEYNAGDTMQVSIRAPYTGSGLITIESNRVHAYAWFKADSTSSVQTITLPPDFEGTGYVSVAFVRSLDSKEIFQSPLSYGVAPFKANFAKRRVAIDLGVPALIRPGIPLDIHYKTDHQAKIIVFAVDEGILQVTGYETPDPLAWFFRKTRLETRTTQIVDLLIPEFSLVRELSAPGGGEEAKLNPFRRVTEKPVVWWSGILDADAAERTATYDVPDYFNGTLRVMAVAIAADVVGSAEKPVLVRGPFVITPGVPLSVVPGDEFEAGVTVANNLAGSGPDAAVSFEAQPSPQLEVVGNPVQELKIPENHEVSTSVRVRVKNLLGSASLKFSASSGAETSHLTATLSVRPATPFMVELRSVNFQKGTKELPLLGGWHEEYRQGTATISAVPLGLAAGLEFYLKNFPYGCSEQITSAAFARMALSDEADFGQPRSLVQNQMDSVFAKQRTRQGGNGAFGYWTAADTEGVDFISVYVMHFLIEAKAAGFNPPDDMLQAGLKHLAEIAGTEPHDMGSARTIAYAIYLLTREQAVATNYLLNLQDALKRASWAKAWNADLTSAYLAASWQLLQKSDTAKSLIGGYQWGRVPKSECGDFYDNFSADSRYLALLARHFPDLLRKVTTEQYERILAPIGEGRYNTLSAAYAVLALKSYAQMISLNPPKLSISGLPLEGKLVQRAKIPIDFTKLLFGVEGKPGPFGVFGQSMEAGFQIQPPKAAVNDGMEVWHELVDDNGAKVTKIELGKPVTVRVVARSKDKARIPNVAVIDLVPGGFEVVTDSIKPGCSDLPGVDFVEVREDRVVLFGELTREAREWTWQLRPVSKGTFVVPPAFAEGMYDRRLKSHGIAGEIEVVQP